MDFRLANFRKRKCAAWLILALGLGSCAHSGAPSENSSAPAPTMPVEKTSIPQKSQAARQQPRAVINQNRQSKSFVQRGSDQFYNGVQSSIGTPPVPAEGSGVLVNFVDAEIAEVAQSVLGEILKVSYSLDEGVSGRLTLQSRTRVSPETVLSMLESELNVRGFGLAKRGSVYWIAPRDKLKAAVSITSTSGRSSAGEGIEIIPLAHISASELQAVLQPIATDGAVVGIDKARNSITISGPGPERERLRELIGVFDVDWMKGMSFAVHPVNTPDPETLAKDVENVIAYQDSPLVDLVRLVPIKRLGAIVVISSRSTYLSRVRRWIAQLDPKGTASGRRLYTYEALHVPAAHLAKLLAQLVGASTQVSTGMGGDIFNAGTPRSDISSADFQPSRNTGNAATTSIASDATDRTRIITDDINDTLLIVATPQEYELIAEAILKLDVEPLQVLIEATIAEISLRDELSYGLQWFFAEGDHSFTLSDTTANLPAQVFPGFSYLLSEGADTTVVLNALDSVTDVSVISSPQIFVRDNGTATLQVGEQVPVATQQAVNTDTQTSNTQITNSIDYREAGVILTVTPRINSQGFVQLDIEQEVSSVVTTTTSGIDSPTIQTRRFQSSVTVRSGQTVALGGLIRDDSTAGSDGVPGLSRIPVVGALFGEKRETTEKTELLALIRPRVVANTSQADDLTAEVRARFEQVSPIIAPSNPN